MRCQFVEETTDESGGEGGGEEEGEEKRTGRTVKWKEETAQGRNNKAIDTSMNCYLLCKLGGGNVLSRVCLSVCLLAMARFYSSFTV